MSARGLAKRILPPALIDAGRRLNMPGSKEWVYMPSGWEECDGSGTGWNVASVVTAETAKWSTFLRLAAGTGPLGIAHEACLPSRLDPAAHNAVMTYGYVLARAAYDKGSISVLDWGGGLAHYYVFSRALLPNIELKYVCRDLPLMCEAGRRLLSDVVFCDDDVGLIGKSFDLTHAGTSLQYARDWRGALAVLASVTSSYLYVARLPVVERSHEFVVVQRAHRYGYDTQYACWYLPRGDFVLHAASCGLHLEREFVMMDRPYVHGAPEQGEYRGFLFQRAVM